MKFVVSSAALYSHLQAISRVINSKSTLPILDCFLFNMEGNRLCITASDNERKRGMLISGGEVDTERMAKVLLDEFRGGKLGRFTLERPEDLQRRRK